MKNIFFKERTCLSRRELRQYLHGQCSREERQSIEHHLLDCPLCSDAVDGLAGAADGAVLEEELSELPDTFHRSGINNSWRWPNWAAAAVLLLAGAYALIQYRTAKTDEHLFIAYFEPVSTSYLTLRGARGINPLEGKPELQQALAYYLESDFASSLPHFSNYLQSYPEDDRAHLLWANALLGAGKSRRARNVLQQLYEAYPQRSELLWYLALAHVKLGEKPKAEALLQQLIRTAPDYRAEAEKLYEALR